jgi:hypothetical protein
MVRTDIGVNALAGRLTRHRYARLPSLRLRRKEGGERY